MQDLFSMQSMQDPCSINSRGWRIRICRRDKRRDVGSVINTEQFIPMPRISLQLYYHQFTQASPGNNLNPEMHIDASSQKSA